MRILAFVLSFWMALPALPALAEKFSFVALGDMPYRLPDDYGRFDRLIERINALKPAFSIHVGDIKSGSSPCTDDNYRKVLRQFQSFEQPLIYTPGDNEWTDCHRSKAGSHDPRERLARVREIFFPDPSRSLGRTTIAVSSQKDAGAKHAAYVENTRFLHRRVMFIQVHVVGSNNGFQPLGREAVEEYFARNAANLAWLQLGFEAAKAMQAKAVVVSMQANMYEIRQRWPAIPRASGFIDTVRAITSGAKAFAGPVLVINGDAHTLEIVPFLGTNMKPVENVTRLQVMGADQVHAVRVDVDTDSPGVFGFKPLIVPENNN
jgi:hypothetical protein